MTATPVRLKLSRTKGFNLQAWSKEVNGLPALNCARPGKLGNPFIIGRDGPAAHCVNLYRLMFSRGPRPLPPPSIGEQNVKITYVRKNIQKVRGKNGGCWCRLCPKHKASGKPLGVACAECDPCHVDVLLEVANR